MKSPLLASPSIPAEDERARMLAYAREPEARAKIEGAQAEIDAGKGIVADDAYFASLKVRRAHRRARGKPGHA